METKILLNVNDANDYHLYKGEYQGVYFSNPTSFCTAPVDKEVFYDVRSLTDNEALEFAKSLTTKNPTFVVDNVMKAIFIKAVKDDSKISFYTDKYDASLLEFISVNKFDLTIKYTLLAPERVNLIHKLNVKINGVFLSRLDEVDVLKYYLTDYVTVNSNIKP